MNKTETAVVMPTDIMPSIDRIWDRAKTGIKPWDLPAIKELNKIRKEMAVEIGRQYYKAIEQITADYILANAMLVKEHLKLEFNRRFSVISERAGASRFEAEQKLNDLELACAHELYRSKKQAQRLFERLQREGELNEDELQFELSLLEQKSLQRRKDLHDQIQKQIFDARSLFNR